MKTARLEQTKSYDTELLTCARAGETWLRTPGAPDAELANPHLESSDAADCWLIGAWAAYHTGRPVKRIHKARGYWFRVELGTGATIQARVDKWDDHRSGIKTRPDS